MAEFIQKSIELIKTTFPNNWWEQYNFDKDKTTAPTLLADIEGFKTKLVEVENQIFDYLNFSVLVGEFCGSATFETDLSELKRLISQVPPAIISSEPEIVELIQKDIRDNFVSPLVLGLNNYAVLHSRAKVKLTLSDKIYILSYHEEILEAIETKQYDENSNENVQFFNANIFIANCDLFLTVETDWYLRLFKLTRDLDKSLNIKPYASTLKSKCNFLIAKILIRKKKESLIPVFILKNTQEEDFRIELFDEEKIFHKEFQYLLTHYEISEDWKSQVTRDFDVIKLKDYKQLTTRELHRLIKYYKDVAPNLESLHKIRQEFYQRFQDSKKENRMFDFFTNAKGLNYCINNEFSLLCELEGTTIDEAEKIYKEICDIQALTGIKNFFPQTKFLKFLLKQLEFIYSKRKALEFIEDCNNIIKKCNEIIKTYETNVSWAKRTYNYVFQLSYKECLISTKSELVPKIFIFSSFLMPLPRQKYQDEFDKTKLDVLNYISSIDVYKNIFTEVNQLKQIKEELKVAQDDLKNREIRLMEVLGIFTAIISFVAASISSFKFIETAWQAIMFTLAMSTSLTFFVILIITFNKVEEIQKRNRKLIFSFLGLSTIFWILVCIIKMSFSYASISAVVVKGDSTTTSNAIINSNNSIVISSCDTCRKEHPQPPKPPATHTRVVYTFTKCPECPKDSVISKP